MKLPKSFWITFSSVAVVLAGCGVPRPDTDLCVVNAEAGYQICYNLKLDYDNSGKRKPDAQPHFKPATTINDLNRNICTDPEGFGNLKAYINELRKRKGK